MKKGIIFDIQRCSYADGPGIRTTVFFKGCNLRCKWCHNPESHKPEPQQMIFGNKSKTCGSLYTSEQVMDEIKKDKAFYDASGGGVTFSGGECMLQADFLEELLRMCKNNSIHTAVDTAGNVDRKYFDRILPYTDLFLYDIKCMSEDKHIEGTGVSNKLILENLERLSQNFTGDIIVRVPVIPGFNDDINELEAMADFLADIRCKETELLPYHKLGENKYPAINAVFTPYSVPRREQMEHYKKIFGVE